MSLYKEFSSLFPYLQSVRKLKNYLSFDVSFPESWKLPKKYVEEDKILQQESPIQGEKLFSFVSEFNEQEVEKIVGNVKSIINYNLEREEKERLFQSKVDELKNVFDVANSLGNEFSNVAHFSTQTLGALSAVTAVTGTTADNAAKVQAVFEQVAGVSSETAASLQMQVASLAQQAGASPKEVLDDIAESAEITSKFFKGDVNLLKQQAIQANRLGTTLAGIAKTATSGRNDKLKT
jgi:hypothetical protein